MSGLERNWLQISCQRSVKEADFIKGVQDFNFSVGGRYSFCPSKSYFRVEMKLQGKTGATARAPTTLDNLAFADNRVV